MHGPVVAHQGRRAVRHRRHHHQRHRLFQQAHRLRQPWPGPATGHGGEGIDRPHHPLRPVAVGRREAPDCEALPQAIQQLPQGLLLPVRIGADRADAVLPGHEGVGLVRLQRDPLEAEIRFQPLQHLGEQPSQMRRRPRRQAGADRQLLHVPIHPERPQRHLPGAPARGGQRFAELIEQSVHRPVDPRPGHDRVHEVARHPELRRRTYRDHRSWPVARDRIQRVQQHPPETPGQRRTGLAQHVADALQSEPQQPRHTVGRQAQHRHW